MKRRRPVTFLEKVPGRRRRRLAGSRYGAATLKVSHWLISPVL